MATIQKMKDQLSKSDKPIEEILHENECFKVSLIGFANGMMLREKQMAKPTKLTVLCGTVKYIDVGKKVTLNKYDEFDIPLDVKHYIIADEQSLCLLTQDRLNQEN